ncbi:hypothetical protein Bca4012_099279 [Brassica carinata]|uniref:Uncharacterized protein n=1 Tax=Brassica carinata TaxID=52824 RepID=A0A8X7TRP3_BRACI|nr:hypothetical protein Bca52824_081913 [Brassica carinata]
MVVLLPPTAMNLMMKMEMERKVSILGMSVILILSRRYTFQAHVVSIITAGVEEFHLNPELGSSDDDEDVLVANLVKCVEDGFAFANSHFTSGATKADVNRMREDGKTGKNRSRKNTKVNLKEPVTDAVEADYVADIVRKSVSAELCKMGEQIKNLGDNLTTSHQLLRTDIQGMFQNFQRDITKFGITAEKGVVEETNDDDADVNLESEPNENHPKSKEPTDVGHSRVPLVAENDSISKDSGDTSLAFPRPTFSLGMTQEDPQLSKTSAPDSEDYGDEHMTVDPPPTSNENDAPAPLYRKSKRPRVVPRSLVGDYQCDKRILVRAWEAHVNATRRVPNIDYAVKFTELYSKLESPFTIKLDGLSLTSKELSAIVDRSTHLPSKVMLEF